MQHVIDDHRSLVLVNRDEQPPEFLRLNNGGVVLNLFRWQHTLKYRSQIVMGEAGLHRKP